MKDTLSLAFSFILLYIIWTVSGDVDKIEFVVQPRSQVAVEGNRVVFHCVAVTTPVEKVRYLWKKDGKYLDTLTMSLMSVSPQGSLIIKSVRAEDFGTYECVAMCEEGSVISQPAKLEKAAFSWKEDKSPVNVKEGGFHLYQPMIKTNTNATFTWKLCRKSDGSCTPINKNRMFVTESWDLLISPISASDTAHYPKITLKDNEYFGTQQMNMGTIKISEYLHSNPKKRCPEAIAIFPQSSKKHFVKEGANLTIDCLGLMKRCENILTFHWKDEHSRMRGSSRKLHLTNVTKTDEGYYTCTIDAYGEPSHAYQVVVLEKPKVVKEPAKTVVLSSDGVVSHGSVTGANSVEWYTNAERIDSKFRFFKLLPSNDLKILPLSSGLAGFYQIIYRNNNGSVMRTVKVDIPNGLCGERSDDLKDKIRFLRPNNLPENRYVSCIWVIQTYLLSNLTFYFTSFSFRPPCDQTFLEIYNGFRVRNSTTHYHFCSASLPSGLFMLSGPYITIYLRGNGTHLKNQGFQLIYGPNVKIPTTIKTKATTTAVSTVTTRKPKVSTTASSTANIATSQKQVTNMTTYSASTSNVSRTPALSTNVSRKTSPVFTSTYGLTGTTAGKIYSKPKTRKSATKKKFSSNTKKPTETVSPKKSNIAMHVSITVVAVVIAIIIVFAILYRRKRARASHTKEGLKDMKLLDSIKSNEYKGGMPVSQTETSFTIKDRVKLEHKSEISNESSDSQSKRPMMHRNHPENDYVVENYTALQFEEKGATQLYTPIGSNETIGRNGATIGPGHANFVDQTRPKMRRSHPENDFVVANYTELQFEEKGTTQVSTPVGSNKTIGKNKTAKGPGYANIGDAGKLPVAPAPEFKEPKTRRSHPENDYVVDNYTELQFEVKGPTQLYTAIDSNGKIGQNGTSVGPDYATITPDGDALYVPVMEPTNSSASPHSNSSSLSRPGQHDVPSDSLWPVYQELECENRHQEVKDQRYVNPSSERGAQQKETIDHTYAETTMEPIYRVLNEDTTDQRARTGIPGEYLAPSQSSTLPNDHIEKPVYSPTLYVQPNPVDNPSRRSKSQHEPYHSSNNDFKEQHAAQEVENVAIYEPIISEDEMYLAIIK